MEYAKLGLVVLLLLVSVGSALGGASEVRAQAQNPPARKVNIPVNVVFVGFDPKTIDRDYLRWGGNLPPSNAGEILYPQPTQTGVEYEINYSLVFAPDAFKDELVNYLGGIGVEKKAPDPWFSSYGLAPNGYAVQSTYEFHYVTYDANKTEEWIYGHQQDLGGFPANGWTLMLMNLTDLPSYDFSSYSSFLQGNGEDAPWMGVGHYYGLQYADRDLGYNLRFRDFFTGWGGVHRFWFADLSAGPSHVTFPGDLPLQIVLADNKIGVGTPYGRLWLTEYVSDYLSEAVNNFVTPWLLYPPAYHQAYDFQVHVIDDRTPSETSLVDIKSTFDSAVFKNAFTDLLPYSVISVSASFGSASQYPGLEKVIANSQKYEDSFTMGVEFAQAQQFNIVDARPVYQYFQTHAQAAPWSWPGAKEDKQTITIYAFVFSNDTLFAFTSKWLLSRIEGVALGDMVLASLSQHDLHFGDYVTPEQPGRGVGLTHTLIHEAGHMLGLPHPFDFGNIGNFISSPMGYYTMDYTFGQADKDALRRAHVDQIYLGVLSKLDTAKNRDQVLSALKTVDAEYAQMDYAAALASALKADRMIESGASAQPQTGQPLQQVMLVLIGAAIGAAAVAMCWLAIHKRTKPRRGRKRSPASTPKKGRRKGLTAAGEPRRVSAAGL